ncbi:MAG: hypothetical protein AAGU11_12385 [Syntrophobacteraceae bacterium]
MNTKRIELLVLALLLVAGFAGIAEARLSTVSPTTANGFPLWYSDLPATNAAGTRLGLCVDATFCDVSSAIAGNPLSERTGFGRKAWYWRAQTRITRGNQVIAEVKMGVEAGYVGGAVAAPRRMTNNFIIIELKNLPVDGNYTVIHPYGRNTFRVVAEPGGGNREVTFINRVGGRNFSLALNGPVGRYLKGVDPAPPLGFIGWHNTLQTVTGSPGGTNFVRIIGPPGANLGGTTRPNVVTQNQFFLSGQLF